MEFEMKRWISGREVREKYDLLPGELLGYIVGFNITGYNPITAEKYISAEYGEDKEYKIEIVDGVEKKILHKVRVNSGIDVLWDEVPISQLDDIKFDINEVELFFSKLFNKPTPKNVVAELENKLEEAMKHEAQLERKLQELQIQDDSSVQLIDPKDIGRAQAKIERIPFLIKSAVAMAIHIAKLNRAVTKDDLRNGIRSADLPVDNLTEDEIKILWKSLPAELRARGRPKKDVE